MASLKCLSVSQPFADLIASGKKTIELRKWNTNFRGEFLIHAPAKIRRRDCQRLGVVASSLVIGAIVGKAVLYGVKEYHTRKEWEQDRKHHMAGPEFSGCRFGFLLRSAKKFAIPIPYKGRLGFFDVTLPDSEIKDKQVVSEIFDEEYRTQWINHH
ncbi:MAG: ASCH domain-containing protein [Candidatus Nitrosotenuis sp.]